MKVKVLKGPIPHGFRYVRAGAIIDLPERLAEVYIKTGNVEAFSDQSKRRRVYRRRDAQPEQTAVMSAETDE